MKLTDLNPRWVGAGGEGIYLSTQDYELGICAPEREGVGIIFDCPCGDRVEHHQCCIEFKNPLDGGECHNPRGVTWNRTGDTFETLTLTPSILRSKEKGGCGWHGWITNGDIRLV